MARRARIPRDGRPRKAEARRPSPPRGRNDYNFDYAGTVGENDQNVYGGDLYGGGRYGRGPFEQSQRFGAGGFGSGTGAYGSLQRQYENRYTSGGYSGLKTSGRALGGPPGTGSVPARNVRLPRAGGRSGADGDRAPRAGHASPPGGSSRSGSSLAASTSPRATSTARRRADSPARSAGRTPPRSAARTTSRPAARTTTSRMIARAPSRTTARATSRAGGASHARKTPRSRPAPSRRGSAAPTKSPAATSARTPRSASSTTRTRAVSASRARTARRSLKGDQRSDQRIRQDICERLSQPVERLDVSDLANEHLDVSHVTVSVEGGKVTLEGTVPERRMKHYIEDLVDACPGVQDIENRIRIES